MIFRKEVKIIKTNLQKLLVVKKINKNLLP